MHSILFLGDSYTIGEGLPLADGYPYQTVQLLRRAGYPFSAPEVIARTGWTTDELLRAIRDTTLLPSYSFVSLLIGVNNQYRGRPAREYATPFTELLQLALRLTDSPAGVVWISIPDWGVSPFAAGKDRRQIATAIDEFNDTAFGIVRQHGVGAVHITPHSRTAGASPDGFVADGLHPARTTYAYWARQLADRIRTVLEAGANPSINAI